MKYIPQLLIGFVIVVLAWQCQESRVVEPPVSPTSQAVSKSAYVPATYNLALNDEFNKPTLDTSIWGYGTSAWGGEAASKKCCLIRPQDTYIQNGVLVNRSTKGPYTGASGTVYPYSTGWAFTKKRFTYGYLEIKAAYPNARGAWPAFWALSDGWPPEIDIAEYRGVPKGYMTHANYDGSWSTKTTQDTGGRFTDFRLYALEWVPDTLKFFLDGVLVHQVTGRAVPAKSMYIILSNGMSCADADGSGFPNYYKIDYFRWYQKPR